MKMLTIDSIKEFRPKVLHKEEIRESDIGFGSTCFCYMISAEGTFDSDWTRECRGITFDNLSGTVNGRSLHKFFNVNERASTQINALDWSKVVRVMDKRDGSMLTTVLTSDGIKLKSKKTFTSDVALAGMQFVHANKNITELLEWTYEAQEFTLIFEYTAPSARIVLLYPEPALTLLHVRQNDTGAYWSSAQVKELGALFGVPVVDEISIDDPMFDGVDGNNLGEKLTNIAKTIEGVEGWVIQFEDGEMVKLKTEWYIALHRTTVFKRVRDIAELCLDEQLDDIKSAFVGDTERLEVIDNIEKTVVADINHLAHEVETLYASVKDMVRKDVALQMQGHEYFALLMQMYSGRVPAYVEWYRKHVLKAKFGLDQI